MVDPNAGSPGWRGANTAPRERGSALIPIFALGLSLSVFFVITYVACIVFYFLFPDLILNHAVLSLFLPGFTLLSWSSFFLGLAESFVYGWYVALVFGPLYNFLVLRWR